ncbi:McrB family protein [Ideonella sp.]|uniref:McrB family protein n=1 Tax=Ideonella sp. TaxID=1929293 RepID=UPI0035AF83D0
MNFQQRQQRYREAVATRGRGRVGIKYSDAFGFSNSSKIVEGGLFAFNVNLDKLGDDVNELVVHCLIRFPPEEEIFFSLCIRSGLPSLKRRLDEMKRSGASKSRAAKGAVDAESSEEFQLEAGGDEAAGTGLLSYTDNNKNVKGYIGRDGLLYTRNKGFWDSLPTDLSQLPPGIKIDEVIFSVWPPEVASRKSLFARDFVGYLGNLVGQANVYEEQAWHAETTVGASMRRMPPTVPIEEVEASVKALGGHYPGGEVLRLHAALNFSQRKHFVILSGLSGTGKTQLIHQYARAVHGVKSMTERDPFLFTCPVRPDWTDPAGLTGYPDVLTRKFLVPTFLEAALLATANPDSPVFVVLDEMNLARVEYYFADVLSCIETPGELLRLHTSSVPMEGSNGIAVPAAMPMPPNLYIIGTVNVDETTHGISDKVLDRAQVIDMSTVDLEGFFASLAGRDGALKTAVELCAGPLVKIHAVLSPHSQAFGYRVGEEVARYMAFATSTLGQSADLVLDDLLVQKVLVKLRGSERQRPMLHTLRGLVASEGKAFKLIDRLLVDLDDFGSFQASR